MAIYSDNFAGTGALSGNWSVVGANSASRASDKASVGASTAIYYTDAASAAQFSEADFPTGTGAEPGIFVCSNNNFSYPFMDGYLWRGNGSGPGWHIWRNGVEVASEATASEYLPANIEDGGRIRLEHDGAGTVRVYHNGVHFATYVDGTPLTALKFGLFSGQSALFDNWEGGDLTPITDPTDITDCDVWLDFDDAGSLTVVSDEITVADDKSGNANDFIPLIGGVGPDYAPATLNGRGVALWPANNTGLRNASWVIPNPSTTFIVTMIAAMDADPMYILADQSHYYVSYHPVNSGSIILDAGGAVFSANTFEIDEDIPYYVTAVFDGASSRARLNGALQFTGVDVGGDTFTGQTDLGRHAPSEHGLGNAPGSYVGEVIVYDRALDDDEIIAVEQYLYDKWFTSGSVDDTAEPSVIAVTTTVSSPTCLVKTFPSAIAVSTAVNGATDLAKATPAVIAVSTVVNSPTGLTRTFPSVISVTTTVYSPSPGQFNPSIIAVPASTSSVSLLGANASRKMVAIMNDSASVLYVKFGTTASSSSFTYKVPAQQTLELPSAGVIYTGALDGIWASAVGNAVITEMI